MSIIINLISSIDPQFEARSNSLMDAARSTCFIGVNPGPDGRGAISGTAFFVSPTILLTAGHMARDGNREIVAQLPGTQKAVLFVDNLFTKKLQVERFECDFIGTGWPDVDICILKVKADYRSSNYLHIEPKQLSPGNRVDVVGYPGHYSDRYVQKMHPAESVDRDAIEAFTGLFPRCELIVSHGTVESSGNRPTYNLSTVVGMSGSPVMMSDKVIGKYMKVIFSLVRSTSWRFWDSRRFDQSVCCIFLEGRLAASRATQCGFR